MTAPLRRAASEAGFLTPQYLLAIGLGLVVFTLMANLIVLQYGRGVLRTALDDGVRAGARSLQADGVAAARCRRTAHQVRRDLLGGGLGDEVAIQCHAGTDRVGATAQAVFDAWLPGVPDWHVELDASAPRESSP